MRLHRFFINNNAEKAELSSNQKLGASKISILNPEIIHQLSKVFRYKIGQKVILFNGTGLDYVYEISKLSKDSAEFIFVEKKANKNLRANFTVAFSIIKKQNNELIIQKCTELGVSDFQPLISERTEKKNFEIDRVTKIAIEAVEQSGQDTIPTINNPMHLSDFLEQLSIINANTFAFDMSGEIFDFEKIKKNQITTNQNITNQTTTNQDISNQTKQEQSTTIKPIIILIGPEGGWSSAELDIFGKKNVKIFSIGKQVLRAETAAIAISGLFLLR